MTAGMTRLAVLAAVCWLGACSTAASNLTAVASPTELPGYSQSHERVFNASVDALSAMLWEVSSMDRDAGIISSERPASFTTARSSITIQVFPRDPVRGDSLVRVGFTSKTGGAIDWGQNARNEKVFFERLSGFLANAPPPAATERAGASERNVRLRASIPFPLLRRSPDGNTELICHVRMVQGRARSLPGDSLLVTLGGVLLIAPGSDGITRSCPTRGEVIIADVSKLAKGRAVGPWTTAVGRLGMVAGAVAAVTLIVALGIGLETIP